MPFVKLHGLKTYQVDGKWYVYIRGTKTALVKNFSGTKAQLIQVLESPEMIGAYNARRKRDPKSYQELSLGWLVNWFTDPEQCRHFSKLADETKERYRKCLSEIEDLFDYPLDEIRTNHIIKERDRIEKDKWPAFADHLVTVLVTMFGLARERGWMKENAAKGIRRTYKSNWNANREWRPEEWATVMEHAPMHLKIAYMLARYAGYRSQSVVAVEWSNYLPDPLFGMCFRMKHRKNRQDNHWLPAAPPLQDFLAERRFPTSKGKIAVRHNGQPWASAQQLQKQSSNFLTGLAAKGLVGEGLTEHGLRVTFAAEIKRVTGADNEKIAAALGDRDARMGAHYTRHVEQEARIIQVFFGQYLRKGKRRLTPAAIEAHVLKNLPKDVAV